MPQYLLLGINIHARSTGIFNVWFIKFCWPPGGATAGHRSGSDSKFKLSLYRWSHCLSLGGLLFAPNLNVIIFYRYSVALGGSWSMQTEALQTPVALFVFKRPDTTRRVFEAISKVRPAKLFLIADGPRQDREGEAEACRQVRDIASRVDWQCEVFKNFSEANLGCGERMTSGLSWVFSQVEESIILEDDCLPDLSFFSFCQELLEKYRGDSRIAYISGDNLVENCAKTEYSYLFSRIGGIWGWATWRSEWHRYDRHLRDWPELRKQHALAEIFERSEAVKLYTRIFDAIYDKRGPDTWDYQWLYTNLKNNSLAIVPSTNLVTNIGFGADATHTSVTDSRFTLPVIPMDFPMKHPVSVIPMRGFDRCRIQDQLPPPILWRIFNKFRKLFGQSIR